MTKNMAKLSGVRFVLLLMFIAEGTLLCLCMNSTSTCVEKERRALLNFKQSFEVTANGSTMFPSWTGEDCCRWKGIGCDTKSGRVVKVDLREAITTRSRNYTRRTTAREVDSSLKELQHLSYLDLSGTDFNGSQIPKFFGSMTRLKYLNLSYGNFGGRIPFELGNLTSLEVLDLRSLDSLQVDEGTNFQWASRLLSLQYLDMSRINLWTSSDLFQVLSGLPSLQQIHLSECGLSNFFIARKSFNSTFFISVRHLDLSRNSLEGPFVNNVFQNITTLEVLDLSSNFYLNSSIPLRLCNLKSLVYLNLADNSFDGFESDLSLLSILNNSSSLKFLDLSGNQIQAKTLASSSHLSQCAKCNLQWLDLGRNLIGAHFPDWLDQLKFLKHLGLYGNSFYGSIPYSIGTLSCLKEIDLSYNQLNGTIPESLGRLSFLRKIDISHNQLSGRIPEMLGRLSALEELDLSDNQLNWTIPGTLGRLVHLKSLDISHNSLEGIISEANFVNLYKLEELFIGFNRLKCNIKSDWVPPFRLTHILMSSCKFESEFPQWLLKQKDVVELDMSNTNISGPLPENIGDFMPSLRFLILSNNLINGSMPDSLCKLDSLTTLDLSGNKLSGEMPRCWSDAQNLNAMYLSDNKLSGTIPASIGNLYNLQWLHVSKNNLGGEIPPSLGNCEILIVLDLGENEFSGTIPPWIGEKFRTLQILRLCKNAFSAGIPLELCSLGVQILDLAHNNLSGSIPRCFGNLTGMQESPYEDTEYGGYVSYLQWEEEKLWEVIKGRELEYTKTQLMLISSIDLSSNNLAGGIPEELCALSALIGLNLSHNNFTGNIPSKIGQLKSLESLDLSNNRLSGLIPENLSDLKWLSFLSLSNNNLSGKIPDGNQLQTLQDASNYAGNPLLCGAVLKKKCTGDHDEPIQIGDEDEDDKEDKLERLWFYLVIVLGYATGFWGVIGALMFNRDFRIAYFRFVEESKDWIQVIVAVKIARLKKRLKRDNVDD